MRRTPPFAALALFLLSCAPVDGFDPVVWRPPEPFALPLDEARDALSSYEALAAGHLEGPEDIALDAQGRVYTGTERGEIVRFRPIADAVPELFATVGGRPLGLAFGSDGRLYVANHGVGLQAVTPKGRVELMADAAGGEPILFADDLHVAPDGTVYLTDASSRFNLRTVGPPPPFAVLDFLEGRPWGRVIRWTPDGEVEVLATGLYFPNGIALAADGRSLFFVESTRYRLSRLWLEGPQRGKRETWLDALPGIGDGLTPDGEGRLLLTLYYRLDFLDRWVLPSGFARQLMVRMPRSIFASRSPRGFVMRIDERTGDIVDTLHDASGTLPAPANAVVRNGKLYMGSLRGNSVSRVPLPGLPGS